MGFPYIWREYPASNTYKKAGLFGESKKREIGGVAGYLLCI